MKHEYWVIFPQRIQVKYEDGSSLSTSMMIVHSQEIAYSLMTDYNGAYFEKIQYRFGKRVSKDWWTHKEFDGIQIERDDLYQMWMNKNEVNLSGEQWKSIKQR